MFTNKLIKHQCYILISFLNECWYNFDWFTNKPTYEKPLKNMFFMVFDDFHILMLLNSCSKHLPNIL